MGSKGDIQRGGAFLGADVGAFVAHGVGRHESDAGVAMLGVVPTEEALAMRTCVLDRTEVQWEVGAVLQLLPEESPSPDLSMAEISFLFEAVATARRFIEAWVEELLAYVQRQGGVS